MPARVASALGLLLVAVLLADGAQAQILLSYASPSCLNNHNVLAGECDTTRLDYDDCNCILQQLKCFSPPNCNYVRFSASPENQCDMGIDNVIFTQVCAEFAGKETTEMSLVTANTMLVMLAIILVDLVVWMGLCCVLGLLYDVVYVVTAVMGIIAFDILSIVFVVEVVRKIEALWFAVFVSIAGVFLQCTLCYIVVPMLDSLEATVWDNNCNPQHYPKYDPMPLTQLPPPSNPYQDNPNVHSSYSPSAPPYNAIISTPNSNSNTNPYQASQFNSRPKTNPYQVSQFNTQKGM